MTKRGLWTRLKNGHQILGEFGKFFETPHHEFLPTPLIKGKRNDAELHKCISIGLTSGSIIWS